MDKELDREQVKLLIECSTDFEKADRIISRYTKLKTFREKIDYLKEMFNAEMIDPGKDDSDEFIYRAILTSIVKINFG